MKPYRYRLRQIGRSDDDGKRCATAVIPKHDKTSREAAEWYRCLGGEADGRSGGAATLRHRRSGDRHQRWFTPAQGGRTAGTDEQCRQAPRVLCELDRGTGAGAGGNELEPAADPGCRGKGEDFADAADVGKCDAGGARGLHAHGTGAAGGDQEEWPDRPAQKAKRGKRRPGHAIDRQRRYGIAGRCDEYWPARPEFRQRSFKRDLRALADQACLRARTHHPTLSIAPVNSRAESCQVGSCAAAARAFMASRCRSARSLIRRRSACANAATSSGGTSRPAPSGIVSGIAPAVVDTTGNPCATASASAIPYPSKREASTNRSDAKHSSTICSGETAPSTATLSSSPLAAISASRCAAAAGLRVRSPAMVSRQGRSAIVASAAISRSYPFPGTTEPIESSRTTASLLPRAAGTGSSPRHP